MRSGGRDDARWRLQIDPPGLAVRPHAAPGAFPADLDQRVAQAHAVQQAGDSVDGMTLGDAGEVEPQAAGLAQATRSGIEGRRCQPETASAASMASGEGGEAAGLGPRPCRSVRRPMAGSKAPALRSAMASPAAITAAKSGGSAVQLPPGAMLNRLSSECGAQWLISATMVARRASMAARTAARSSPGGAASRTRQ